jgi:hypothetical protein
MQPNEAVFLEGQISKLKRSEVISFCDSIQGLPDWEREKKSFVFLVVFTVVWMKATFFMEYSTTSLCNQVRTFRSNKA